MTAPPSDPPPIYDRREALSIAGGKAAIADHLLGLLLERDLPAQEQALAVAFRADDRPTLREVAHKLRGSATYCGLTALKLACRSLEQTLADTGPAEAIAAHYDQVHREIGRVRQHFGPES